MNLVLDLDGTLIDASERMYRLFQRLVPDSHFSKEHYWELKRNKFNHQMILETYFPQYEYSDFNQHWLREIEDKKHLDLDCLFSDTLDTLSELKKHHSLILLTARQSKENLLDELMRLDLLPFFDCILVTEAKTSKENLLLQHNYLGENSHFFVSDMGSDISIGNKFGYITIGITHGFMSEEKLAEYNPDYMVEELNQLRMIVL